MRQDKWVLEIRPVGKDRCEVICEGDDSFVLYHREIERYGIAENSVCPAETFERICDEVLRQRAKNRCMYLIEKQDYTQAQIRQKLQEGCYPEEIISETLAWLKEQHAVDDRRYAENYIRMHCSRTSRRMLERKLMQRGIGKEMIDEIFLEEPACVPDEAAQITELLARKGYSAEEATAKEREKIRQMLAGKGFEYSLIRAMT